MGHCGCGDTHIDKAFTPTEGVTIGLELYAGCPECFRGLAFAVYAFNDKGKDQWIWPDDAIDSMPADEYGGNDGRGCAMALFEVEDLMTAATALLQESPMNDYITLQDWLHDNGLQLLRGALNAYEARTKKAGDVR